MPSISASKVEANKQAEFMDSFKQAIIVVEHKIRNLEKRKGKLDAYKQEQEQGKELNADQLAAVAKYNEVVQQLDFSRDLVKQLGQIGEETNRVYRKQQKKEQTDRALVEAERYRQLLTFQRVLDKLANNQRIREDFLNGVLGTVKLTPDDISSLDEFASLISPERDDPNYLQQVTTAGEHISLLFQGKAKPVAGKNYKEIQALLLSISSCEYFDPQNNSKQQQQQQPQQQQTFSEEPEPLAPPTSTTTVTISSTTNVGPVPVNEPVPAQIIHSQEPTLSTYNFIQESQIEIGSPHLDPAVVSVSSFAPPQQNLLQQQQQQQQVNNNSQNVFSNTVDNINSGLTDMSLNRLSTKPNDEEIMDEWNEDTSAIPNSTYNSNSNPIDSNGRGDGANNMFDRTIRGGFRGNPRSRGGRGTNSYGPGPRGGGRGRGGGGGFQNGRGGGGYRSDRPESDLDGNVYEANRNPRKRRGVGYPYPNASQQQNVSYNSGGYSSGSAPPSSQQQPRARQNNQVPPNRLNTTYPKN